MGCLQKSVWVTPRDIRPEFDDLCKGAALGGFAFLFESRTVLGLPSDRIVTVAWDFDRLADLQSWYCRTCEKRLKALVAGGFSDEELTALAGEAIWAYRNVMEDDPLLPKRLCPPDYQGRRAHWMHRKMMQRIGSQVR
jgi:DNA-binding transcriptional regulator PaaX